MMKRALLGGGLLLSVALVASPAAAQIGFAKGRVVDAQGQPVADASVTAVYLGEMPKTSARKTNKKGEYVHAGLYGGRYRITTEKEGYEPTVIEHDVTLGDPTELPDIVLQPKKAPEVKAREAAANAPEEVKAKFAKAVDLTTQGQLAEAEALFKELLVVLPDVAEIHQNLGYIHAQRKDWANAEASYAKALELQPGNATSMSALAAIYESMGQHDKALALTQQAAAADPGERARPVQPGGLPPQREPERGGHRRLRGRARRQPGPRRGPLPPRDALSGPEQRPQGDRAPRGVRGREPQGRAEPGDGEGPRRGAQEEVTSGESAPGRAPRPRPPRSDGRRGRRGTPGPCRSASAPGRGPSRPPRRARSVRAGRCRSRFRQSA